MTCQQCKRESDCLNNHSCWCYDYPILKNITSNKACFCKECLIENLANEINTTCEELDKQTIMKICQLGIPETLRESVDYNINDEGLYIFTRWYLLRRGHCCNNGCLNCPYNYK